MSFQNPSYMQKLTTPAVNDRFIIDTLFTEGILNVAAGQGLVIQRPAGAAMQVRVPILDCIIKGDDATGQGSYLVRMDVAEDVNVTAASATNPRIDLLVVEVLDSVYRTTSGFDGARLRLVVGTAAASPVVPDLPPTAIPLAQIAVPTNAQSVVTANITDRRGQSGAATLQIGTQALPLTTAQRLVLTNPAAGILVFDTTLGKLFTYGGAALGWVAGLLDVQTFTASGTWTKPAGAVYVVSDVAGAGGAGGSGNPSNQQGAYGGGGGGGGARYSRAFPAAFLPATVPVTVGAGGVATAGASASAGAAGGGSSFGVIMTAGGGTGGPGGGSTSTASLNATGGSSHTGAGEDAGQSVNSANLATGVALRRGAGAGGQGGQGNTTTAGAGFIGGTTTTAAAGIGGVAGQGVAGGIGGSGAAGAQGFSGGGGGGGGASTSGLGGNGGAGGVPGGGGGGCGNSFSAASAGPVGGPGGRGEVTVYTICL